MLSSFRTLVTELVDYAGLFPPAGLGMEEAVRNYEEYRAGEHAWMLGRFIVPVARLSEFKQAAFGVAGPSGAEGWRLSVLSDTLARDLYEIVALNDRHEGLRIDALEVRAGNPEAVREGMRAVQDARREGMALDVYYEIPLTDAMPSLIETIGEVGAFAKIRTGGLTAEAFPNASDVVRFIHLCHRGGVAFKATAGLHHPLRSVHPFTYEAESPCGTMHGFLNVFLAAAFMRNGMDEPEAVRLLEESQPEALVFEEDAVTWREHRLTTEQLRLGRAFAHSFGSCSFTEPVRDLQVLELL